MASVYPKSLWTAAGSYSSPKSITHPAFWNQNVSSEFNQLKVKSVCPPCPKSDDFGLGSERRSYPIMFGQSTFFWEVCVEMIQKRLEVIDNGHFNNIYTLNFLQ